MKWGESKKESDTILAVWPVYEAYFEKWFMHELVMLKGAPAKWRRRSIQDERGFRRADHYADRETATLAARQLNPVLFTEFLQTELDPVRRRSTELRIAKGIQAKERLHDEEELMRREAGRRHQHSECVVEEGLLLAPEAEKYREDLIIQLNRFPYLKVARVRANAELRTSAILYKGMDTHWSEPYNVSIKSAMVAERAKIANGFGLSAQAHWGKSKAKIREILLPRANKLLQIASVQRLLADALGRGQRALVSNGVVFWYEDECGIGWQIKETSRIGTSANAAIWKEGTIRSTNHGRLIVLPYIKECGEQVRGHTKNGPNDGQAKPRHPDQYVDIPFTELDGDLMIGLMGQLPYE